MLGLTPGMTFMLRLSRATFTPPLVAHFFLKQVSSKLPFVVPTWVRYIFCIMSLPVWLALRSLSAHIQEEREISALGAVRVPELRMKKWPGNLDLVFARLQAGKDGYPGKIIVPFLFSLLNLYFPADVMLGLTKQYGKIVNMRILGKDRVSMHSVFHEAVSC